MAGDDIERRLAAILCADMVGYSRLMQADEPGTFAALTGYREELIEPMIVGDHGCIVKLMGDGVLVEYVGGMATEIGFELEECDITGGVSDGNFTAAPGVPTLDGLGVDGAGVHTHHEHFYDTSLKPRAPLMIRLLETL